MTDDYRRPTTDDRSQTAEDRGRRTEDGRLPAAEERPAGAYEVRCPNCHALQFLARVRWECVPIDEATVAIKCWRRTCKRVLGLRIADCGMRNEESEIRNPKSEIEVTP